MSTLTLLLIITAIVLLTIIVSSIVLVIMKKNDDTQVCENDECGTIKTTPAGTEYECKCQVGFVCNDATKKCEACPAGTLWVDGICVDDTQVCNNECGSKTTPAGTQYICNCDEGYVCNEETSVCEPTCPPGTLWVDGECIDDTRVCDGDGTEGGECGDKTTAAGTTYKCTCGYGVVCNPQTKLCEPCPEGYIWAAGICVEDIDGRECVGDGELGGECGEKTTAGGTTYTCECNIPYVCNNGVCEECPAGTHWVDGICIDDTDTGECIGDGALGGECGAKTTSSGKPYVCECDFYLVCNEETGKCEECPEGTLYVQGVCLDDQQVCEDGECGVEKFTEAGTKYVCECEAPFVCNETTHVCEACPEGTLYVDGVCKDDTQTCGEKECGDKTTAAGTAYTCQCGDGFVCNGAVCEACPEGTLYVEGVCVDDAQVCENGECGVEKTTEAGTVYVCECEEGFVCNETTHVCEACPEGTLWVDGVCKDDKQTCTGDGAVAGECGDKTTAAGTAYKCNCKDNFVCNGSTKKCEACPAGTLWVAGVCKDDTQVCENSECGVEKTTDAGTVYVCECEEGFVCNETTHVCEACPEGTLYVDGVCKDDTQTCGEKECGDKITAAGTAYTCQCGDGLICNGTVCEACPAGTLWVDGVCKDDKQVCTGDGAVAGECGDKTTAAGTAYTCDCKEPNVCNTTTHVCEACPADTLWVEGVCVDDAQVCENGECGVEKTTDAGTVYVCECEEGFVCNTTTHVCEACPEGTLYVDGVCKDDKQTCTGDGAVAGECGDKTTAAGTAYKCDCKEPNVCNTTTKKCEACPAGTLWVDGVCKDDKQVCTGEGAVGGECGVEKTTAAGTKYTCKCDAPNVCNTTTHVCEACPEGTLYVEGVCVDDTQVCTGDGASGGECGDKTTDAGTAYTCTCKAPFVCNETTVLCEQCKVGWTYEDGKCVEDSEEA